MSNDHGHAHDLHATAAMAHRGRLAVVLALGGVVLASEVVGALWSGSLALLADAGHLLADLGGIGLALLAVTRAQRPATAHRTFGWQRFEILAAVTNALLLLAVGGTIALEAVRHLFAPPATQPGIVVAFGLVAIAGNAVSVWLLRGAQRDSLNMRGAFLEAMADLLGAFAVVVSAVVVALTGFERADAIAALLLGALIVPRTWALLRQGVHILMEAAPEGLDLAEVRDHILQVPGVVSVHDLHAWTITSGAPMLSAHVVVDDQQVRSGSGGDILDTLQACLEADFAVVHTTFQIEPTAHTSHEVGGHA